MKLATLKTKDRDGRLLVVNKDLTQAVEVPSISPNLQSALEDWSKKKPLLEKVYHDLNSDALYPDAFNLSWEDLMAPLPRSFQWLDGSAYVHHVELARKSRGAHMPDYFWKEPLMYQGCSDKFLSWCDDIVVPDKKYGADFESELAVVLDDVQSGVRKSEATEHIALIMLMNDISYRHMIPHELSKGFGFVQSKPHCSCSPFVITPDELDGQWRDNKVHLPVRTFLNKKLIGEPNAGVDMQFDFADLIVHAAKTRSLHAGTIIGSGTISNKSTNTGSSCMVEKRMLELMESGEIKSTYLKEGDRVRIELMDLEGKPLLGAIDQKFIFPQ